VSRGVRWVLATFLVTTIVASACRPPATREMQGLLIDVQSHELLHADEVTVRDNSGAVRTFRVSPEVATNAEFPFSASHLRQHMIIAQPVVVEYQETNDGLLALRIRDATT
jgi:hypothetical protein